jgi:hypothetical protein
LVSKVYQENKVQLDLQVSKDPQVLSVRKEMLVLSDPKVPQVVQVVWEHQVPLEFQV